MRDLFAQMGLKKHAERGGAISRISDVARRENSFQKSLQKMKIQWETTAFSLKVCERYTADMLFFGQRNSLPFSFLPLHYFFVFMIAVSHFGNVYSQIVG